jgi:hypothetical protein
MILVGTPGDGVDTVIRIDISTLNSTLWDQQQFEVVSYYCCFDSL